jgi:4-hydroxy-4-methyl-2-oxoglutarate aldolase
MESSAQAIEQLRQFDSATIANALEAVGIGHPTEGFASLEVRCQFPELPPMAGVAVTCTHDSTSRERPPSRLHELLDTIQAASVHIPTVVVCQYVGSQRERGCFIGDLFACLIQRLGGVGVVTDTGVRDLKGITSRAPGLQVFAAGCVASHGLPSIVDVGTRVSVGGLEVEPGDVIHGDVNGVVRIPAGAATQVGIEAAKVLAVEAQIVDLIRQEPLPYEELKSRFFQHGYQ